MNIVVDSNIPFLADSLKNIGDIIVLPWREINNAILKKINCQALFIRSTIKANSNLLSGTNVQYLATATSGTDHFDEKYLKEAGITYDSALGSNANSVAEYVIYSVLKYYTENNIDLKKRIIGIVGFGCVGKLVAKYANKIGLKILINDPPLQELNTVYPNYCEYSDLENLITNSDIISNHVPLNKLGKYPTIRLFDQEKINMINRDSLFIHASRGGVVDESILLGKMKSGAFTCVIDVWENEPRINSGLVDYPMISTPHIAGHTYDGKIKGSLMLAESFKRYANTKIDLIKINEILNEYVPLKDSDYENLEKLCSALKESRKIDLDSLEFKKLNKLDSEQRILKFQEMRNYYPIRREIL